MFPIIPLDTANAGGSGSMISLIVVYAAIFVGAYFLLIRPQNKKKKKEESMKKSAKIGDEITTIGGIEGRIISEKEDSDSITIETGADRTRLRIKRWAIGSVDTVHEED